MSKTMIETKALDEQIGELEEEIAGKKKKLAELRRQIPGEPLKDYTFKGSLGEPIKLSALFGDKDELIVIHNMGKRCPYCTMWADGFNGVLKHLEDRAGFVVSSPDDSVTQRKFSLSRDWKFRMVSTEGTAFKEDMGFGTNKNPQPGVTVFKKDRSGKIFQTSSASFGPGDNYCIVWDLFNLLPTNDAKWEAKFHYYP